MVFRVILKSNITVFEYFLYKYFQVFFCFQIIHHATVSGDILGQSVEIKLKSIRTFLGWRNFRTNLKIFLRRQLQLVHNFGGFLAVSFHSVCLSSVVILDDDRKLIGDLTVFTSTEFDDVVVVTDFLTFHFELALLLMVLEVNEESDDACEKQSSNSSASYARSFEHHTRSSGCVEKNKLTKFSDWESDSTYTNKNRRDPCNHIVVQWNRLHIC